MASTTYSVSDLGSLNTSIIAAAHDSTSGDTITIDLAVDISLSSASVAIEAIKMQSGVNLVINGGNHVIDGGGAQRGLFVYAGNVTISDLTIQNALAQGGAGATGLNGGGGGAGLGGAAFSSAPMSRATSAT